MTPPQPGAVSRRHRLLWPGLGAALILVSLPAASQSEEPPEGIAVGKWVLAPYVRTLYEYNDNIFFRSDDGFPESDRVTTVSGGVVATMPFRNSELQLGWEGDYIDYADNVFTRDVAHELNAGFTLRFGSGDQVIVTDQFLRGITDVQSLDQGGELTFAGEPYSFNRLDVEVTRAVPKRQGYSIRVARVDLNFDDEPAVQFFDYRGFETSFEYRQPLPSRKWVTAAYDSRRFNNYKRCPVRDPMDPTCEMPQADVGEPYRREEADSLLVGVRGLLGRNQPFFFRGGYGRLRYVGQPSAKEFAGVVAQARWRLGLGSRSDLDLLFTRRPLPSNFDSYYIINELQARFRRSWLPESRYGANLIYSRNRYGNVITVNDGAFDCGGEIRRDQYFQAGAYVEWAPHELVGLRLEGRHLARSSNCDGSSYDANEIFTGLSFGWF